MKYILALILCLPGKLLADVTETTDAVHIAAHFGATYALTHIGEVVCHKATNQSKLLCTIESALLANALNIGRKAAQSFPSDTKRAVMSGVAGSLTAGIIIQLDF